jgi:hypothetical protein
LIKQKTTVEHLIEKEEELDSIFLEEISKELDKDKLSDDKLNKNI